MREESLSSSGIFIWGGKKINADFYVIISADVIVGNAQRLQAGTGDCFGDLKTGKVPPRTHKTHSMRRR